MHKIPGLNMHRNQFLSYIENPKHAAWHTDVYSPLLAQFPYCQTLHLMYAKHLHYIEHFSFQQQLKLTAAYAGNRSILHHLINQNSIEENSHQNLVVNKTDYTEDSIKSSVIADADVTESESLDLVNESIETNHGTIDTSNLNNTSIINEQRTKVKHIELNGDLLNDKNLEEANNAHQTLIKEVDTDVYQQADTLEDTIEHSVNKIEAEVAQEEMLTGIEKSAELENDILEAAELALMNENQNTNRAIDETITEQINLQINDGFFNQEQKEEHPAENSKTETAPDAHPKHLHEIIEARLAELVQPATTLYHLDDDKTENNNNLPQVETEVQTDETTTDTTELTIETVTIENKTFVSSQTSENDEEKHDSIVSIDQKPSEKHTFSDWLKQVRPLLHLEEIHAQPATVQLKAEIKPLISFPKETDVPKIEVESMGISEPNMEIIATEISSKENLIDKFILTQPRIEPQRSTFYSPSAAARNSVIYDETVVSETLALIFERQQLYQKAINAYEKLSLMFPEKSDLFAARITDLKQKKGNSH
jgi:hypothetical protein